MSMTENPRHHLEFDGLDLTGRTTYGEGAQWWRYEALGEGASPGNSEPLTSEQASALFDGALVTLDRWGNRVQSWPVRIVAANSAGLALGERMLTSRTGDRRVTMAYEPPDGWGARTLWDVLISSTAHQFDDMNELRCQRVYTLNLTCAPFGYADREVTTSGTIPGEDFEPTTVAVSDGTSATGWTGMTVGSYGLRFSGSVVDETRNAVYALGSSLDLSATPYVRVTYRPGSWGGDPGLDLLTGTNVYAHEITSLAKVVSPGVWSRTWELDPTATTTNNLTFKVEVFDASAPPEAASYLRSVEYSNVRDPDGFTGTVLVGGGYVEFKIPGSSPAAGVIHAFGPPGNDLDEVLVYTSPSEAMRLEHGLSYAPGTYLAIAPVPSVSGSPQSPISVTFSQAGASEDDEVTLTSPTIPAFARFIELGLVTLPLCDVPRGSSLGVTATEDVYLFGMEDGSALTWVDLRQHRHLWIVDPVLGDETPGVFVGDNEDMSDAHFPGAQHVKSWGRHRLTGDRAPIFVAGAPMIEFRHRPAFFHFATHVEDS